MTDIEIALTDLGELATRELSKKYKPQGLEENKRIAKLGGNTAKIARDDLERKLEQSVITNKNKLSYQYTNNRIKNK